MWVNMIVFSSFFLPQSCGDCDYANFLYITSNCAIVQIVQFAQNAQGESNCAIVQKPIYRLCTAQISAQLHIAEF